MFKNRRKLLSQNFFKDRNLVTKLLRRTSIGKNDTVIDIGAGKGIITSELAKKVEKVFAIEIDKDLAKSLTEQFKFRENVIVLNKDFRDFYLPTGDYKVFSNIPFIDTSSIVKKLLFSDNPPIEAYLVVQKEAAYKLICDRFDKRNSQISILTNPFFEIDILHQFKSSDFHPRPRVDSVLLYIKKRDIPLIGYPKKYQYQDFVVYAFNQTKSDIVKGLSNLFGNKKMLALSQQIGFSPISKPRELTPEHWLELFNYFLENTIDKSKVIDSFKRQLKYQQNLHKIHRTRRDGRWRHFP